MAKVKTRFGGRYVRGVDGLEEHGNRAWFYYVNGYLADRSAADYRLRAGDLAWWDYRAWQDPAQDPVVLGAFPQPFLSGYDGKRRPAVVVSTDPRARAVAKRLHARVARRAPADANVLVLGRERDEDRAARLLARLAGAARLPGRPEAPAAQVAVPLPLRGGRVSPAPAALLLAGLAAAALLADRIVSVAAIVLVLLLVCLRAPAGRRRLYLVGALGSGLAVFLLTPFVSNIGWHVIWSGPSVPVLGQLDITREELRIGLFQGLRLTAVALAFAAYALLLDHDRLVQSVRFARRSVLAMALATRLVPTLERDAAGLVEALRGRGVEVTGARGRARLLAPLLAGSLERALNLAEAMEARGYGRPGGTRTPRPGWGTLDRAALAVGALAVAIGALWL